MRGEEGRTVSELRSTLALQVLCGLVVDGPEMYFDNQGDDGRVACRIDRPELREPWAMPAAFEPPLVNVDLKLPHEPIEDRFYVPELSPLEMVARELAPDAQARAQAVRSAKRWRRLTTLPIRKKRGGV